MKLFMIKSLLIGALCFLCILLGMQLANDGMKSMRGYEDESLTPVVKKDTQSNGVYVLGENISQDENVFQQLDGKNFMSKAGESIANVTESIFTVAADYTGEIFDKVKAFSQ